MSFSVGRIRKWICLILSALMVLSALSGCGDAAEEAEDEEQFLVRGSVCAPIESFDPAMNTDTRAQSVFYALYENLMRETVDEEGHVTLEPGAAKEYTEVPNFDGTVEYYFKLRSTARWSDGSRVKAKDFVYAWKRLLDPAVGSPNGELLSMVQGYDEAAAGDLSKLAVKAEGDSIFHVKLQKPCAYFLSDICTAVPTMPLRSEQESKNPDWPQSSVLLCNGPYQIGVWARESYLQLRRNTSYHDNRAVVPDLLRLYFSNSVGEAWQSYEDGSVDFAPVLPGRAGASAYPPLRTVSCVFYNHMSDVFSNAHVRRALDLTLDRSVIAAAVGPGMRPATGVVPDGIAGASPEEDFRSAGGCLYATDEETYAKACEEAQEELRAAGYTAGSAFPEVTCIYAHGDELRAAAAKASAVWSETLGIVILPEALEQEEFDRRLAEGEYDLAFGTITARYADPICYLEPFAGADAANLLHYANKPFDLLIRVAETTRDEAGRLAILHDAEALLLEDAALSPLYFGSGAYMLRDTLTGIRCDRNGNYFFTAVRKTEQTQ